MNRHVRHGFVALLLLVFQTATARLLSVEGVAPDFLSIWIVYLALKEGQLSATLWGFGIGLGLDLVAGNFWGLSALTKTVCGFVAGYFYNEHKTRLVLGSYRFLLIIITATFIQNLVYFVIFTQGSDIPLWQVLFQYGLSTTLYSAAFSLVPIFVFSRKSSIPGV